MFKETQRSGKTHLITGPNRDHARDELREERRVTTVGEFEHRGARDRALLQRAPDTADRGAESERSFVTSCLHSGEPARRRPTVIPTRKRGGRGWISIHLVLSAQ